MLVFTYNTRRYVACIYAFRCKRSRSGPKRSMRLYFGGYKWHSANLIGYVLTMRQKFILPHEEENGATFSESRLR